MLWVKQSFITKDKKKFRNEKIGQFLSFKNQKCPNTKIVLNTASEKECFCNLTSTFECKKIITTSYRKKYPTKWSNDIDVFLVIVKFKRIEKNAENENVTF